MMLEKGKISALQMGILMYPTIMATAILVVPSITFRHAERDMWISPIWGSVVGFALTFITYQLHKLYPGQNLIQYSEQVFGKIGGRVCGLLFLLMQLHDAGFVIREYGEFVIGNFLSRTPVVMVMGCLVAVCAFAVRSGVEVIARCGQVFVPLFILLLVMVMLLLGPEYTPHNMMPVLENGIGRSFRGALAVHSWFSDFMLLSFLLPAVSDGQNGRKWGLIAVVSVMLTMVTTNIAILMLFGDLTVAFNTPFMVASRYIGLADFVEHLEAMTMAIWVLVIFVKMCIYYYVFVLGSACWLRLEDYRLIVFPAGICIVVLGVWAAPNMQEMSSFFDSSGLLYSLTFKGLLPALLCAVALVRHKFRSPSGTGGRRNGSR
ncbi:hypothetical protein PAESOLCIP111_04613 [Paenibacillus solanacearum]|uniref:Uncharacterized protein n=1 Tax=Paenibacillus solanacearum TaxID=2048548 RepID=A0A916NK97_9BACL|nr:endospore germination permease [Paenibacillus solanacearum]CAG7644057.1 hypothetical protein PAESOLCIP111_04613 [Paenibacillus solanacearum]